MEYNLHGLPEIIAAISVFAIIGIFGWYHSARRDISDDSRMFR